MYVDEMERKIKPVTAPQIVPQTFPSTSFPIPYSLLIQFFDTIYPDILECQIKKKERKKETNNYNHTRLIS